MVGADGPKKLLNFKHSRLTKTHSKFKESSAYYKFAVLYLAINAITGIKTVIVIHLFYA